MHMYNLMNGGNKWVAVIFSVGIIVLGSFFVINLVLAVIMQAFISNNE